MFMKNKSCIFPFFREHIGESIVYIWAEKLRELLVEEALSREHILLENDSTKTKLESGGKV